MFKGFKVADFARPPLTFALEVRALLDRASDEHLFYGEGDVPLECVHLVSHRNAMVATSACPSSEFLGQLAR